MKHKYENHEYEVLKQDKGYIYNIFTQDETYIFWNGTNILTTSPDYYQSAIKARIKATEIIDRIENGDEVIYT